MKGTAQYKKIVNTHTDRLYRFLCAITCIACILTVARAADCAPLEMILMLMFLESDASYLVSSKEKVIEKWQNTFETGILSQTFMKIEWLYLQWLDNYWTRMADDPGT